jgi:predicted phosphate transport protein (TIGR00153 family)
MASNDFFGWFETAAQLNVTAAQLLAALCRDYRQPEAVADQIRDLEHQGDEVSHAIYAQLNQVFLPPLDREDIIVLARTLDDVLDRITVTAGSLSVYNIQQPTLIAVALADTVVACTREIARAVPLLRERRTIAELGPAIIEVNRLENQGDVTHRLGLIELFHTPHEFSDVLAWDTIYDLLEGAIDMNEDIADVLRTVVIKYK